MNVIKIPAFTITTRLFHQLLLSPYRPAIVSQPHCCASQSQSSQSSPPSSHSSSSSSSPSKSLASLSSSAPQTFLSYRDASPPPEANFELISQKQIFKRYQTVYQRDIRYPNGRVVSFDVSGNELSDFRSVFIFPFDTATKTATLIREYSPGRNAEQLSLVAGMFEPSKHTTLEEAARAELSEEARLRDGTLIPLTTGVAADKYSLNKYFYFLALDCVQDSNPMARDEEEWIHILPGFPLPDIPSLVTRGFLNVPNSLCALLALDKLRQMGYGT